MILSGDLDGTEGYGYDVDTCGQRRLPVRLTRTEEIHGVSNCSPELRTVADCVDRHRRLGPPKIARKIRVVHKDMGKRMKPKERRGTFSIVGNRRRTATAKADYGERFLQPGGGIRSGE